MLKIPPLFLVLLAAQDSPPDPSKFELLGSAKGHYGRTNCVSLSGDGKIAVSGGEDRTFKVWEVDTGKILYQVPKFTIPVTVCAVSKDGSRAAVFGGDRTVYIYDLAAKKEVASYTEETHIYHLQFTLDGKSIVSIFGGAISLRDATTPSKVTRISGSEWREPHYIAVSQDSQFVATTGTTQFLQCADMGTAKVISTVDKLPETIKILAVNNNAGHVAYASGQSMSIHNPRKKGGKDVVLKKAHEDDITAMAFSPDGKTLATGDAGGSVRLWSLDPATIKKFLNGHTARITQVSFSHDGSRIATSSADGTIRIWSGGGHVTTLEGHESFTSALAVLPDRSAVATSGSDRAIRLWSLPDGALQKTGSVAHPKTLHEGSALDLRSVQPAVVAFTSEFPGKKKEEVSVKWWSGGSEGRGFDVLKADEEDMSPFILRCSPVGDYIAVGGKIRKTGGGVAILLRVYQGSSGRLVKELEDSLLESVDFSPDGRSLVMLGTTLRWVDMETGTIRDLERFANGPSRKRSSYLARFTRDGQKIAFTRQLDKIELFDLKADKIEKAISVNAEVRSLAMGPTADFVTVGCEDGAIRIFDLNKGAVVATLSGQHREGVTAVGYSEDGKIMVSASLEIRIWGQK